MKLPEVREFTIALAHRAGDLLLDILDRGLDQRKIKDKLGYFDVVTEGDLASEQLILAALDEAYPGVPVMAEESAPGAVPDVEWLWLVDPVDGTTNFSHAFPIFGVNLALVHRGIPVVGVTHDPSNDRTYWAERGAGAWLRSPRGEKRLQVSQVHDMQRALLSTGFQYSRLDPRNARRTEFAVLDNLSQSVRRIGAASIACAWVAAGYMEAYWETALKPWDFGPGWVLLEEAGGSITEHDGSPATLTSRTLIMSNGQQAIDGAIRQVIADVAAGRYDAQPGASR